MGETFPAHDELDVMEGRTIYKSDDWWKAVLLYEGFGERNIGIYLWKKDEDWKRQQKYVVRSEDEWHKDRAAVESLLPELAEI